MKRKGSKKGRAAHVPLCVVFVAAAVAVTNCSDNTWHAFDGGGDDSGGRDSGGRDSGGRDSGRDDGGGDDGGRRCIDTDGDGYGAGCALGPDCDDGDASTHSGCSSEHIGGGGGNPWSPTDENSSGVRVDDDGGLTLLGQPELEPAVWIANSGEGTVSRLDAESGDEIARYPSVLASMSSARPYNESCSSDNSTGNCPSRTAIDFRGDCWVANRAFGNQGTVTKIASRIEDCIDRNNDGEIQTSTDLNDNGIIELGTDEFLGEQDECLLFTVDVGGNNGIPRALAIAPDASGEAYGGNAWVGLNSERAFVELDGDTGAVRRTVPVPLNPYGALASKYEGRVWMVNAGWQNNLEDNSPGVAAIDFRSGQVTPRYEIESESGCVDSYGLTIDAQGRVWVGGRACNGAFRFDPSTEQWMTVDVPNSGVSRGLVADADGQIWLAHCRDDDNNRIGLITRFSAEDGSNLAYYHLPSGLNSIGVDIDAYGRIWTVNGNTHDAARIDPVSGTIDEFPVGRGPYTYSDFTGHSLLLQFPRGYYRHVVEACSNAMWRSLAWDAQTPGDTTVELRVRSAATRIDLGGAQWHGPYTSPPADLQLPPNVVPDGAFLEIEITLISMDEVAVPTVEWVEATYECPVG